MEFANQLEETRTLLNRAQTASSAEEALDLAVSAYLQAAGCITLFEEIQKDAKALITEVFAKTGQTEAVTSAAKIIISKPSISVSYDAKSLDILLRDDADLAMRLSAYRKETTRAGTLRIIANK